MSLVPACQNTLLENASVLINALCRPDAYPHEIQAVKRIETHISTVLLTGTYAYKIKKPVNFGFLDFSTLENRRFYCYEELRLNRRLSKDLYLEVVPITGTAAHPKIAGTGEIIEYAVKMKQFPTGLLLSEFAEQGKLDAQSMDRLAVHIADFHARAERATADSEWGSSANIKHWFDENFEHIEPLLDSPTDLRQLSAVRNWGESEWRHKADLLELRRAQGFVREGHGDLHLSNITIIGGAITPFDCIEFNALLRWIDVQSEIAFLAIDLCYFGYTHLAYRFVNRYLQQTGDYSGLQVFRYYLVYRALVLAKVSLLKRSQQQEEEAKQRYADYKIFADLAERFTKHRQVYLIITHGYSGAGKSRLAGLLSEQLGAIWLRSDIERKRLFGFSALADTGSGVDTGLYTQDRGLLTYQRLAELAGEVISAGFPVIIDAAFLQRQQRDCFRQLAAALSIAFLTLDVQASERELEKRIRQRRNDVSEATIAVLKKQLQTAEPLSGTELYQTVTVDTEQLSELSPLLAKLNNYLSALG